MRDFFRRIARGTSRVVGSPWAFIVALVAIALWAFTGSLFHYSDTWQLVINTGTTIVTFLVVFLIQNTQNRDSEAVHLKLDELIRSHRKAKKDFANLENLTDSELEQLRQRFEQLRLKAVARQAERAAKKASTATTFEEGTPSVPAGEQTASDTPSPQTAE